MFLHAHADYEGSVITVLYFISDTGSVLILIIITVLEHSHYSSPYILILFGLLKSVSNM